MRQIRTSITMVLALGALACSDRPGQEPTGPLSAATTQAQCQAFRLSDLARRYLPASQHATARILVAELDSLVKAGSAAATDKGFDILALIEAAANQGPAGTPQDGSTLASATLACMNVGTIVLPIDFRAALTAGGFAVRGGPADPAGPILSRDQYAGIGVLSETTWPNVLGQRALIHGAPVAGAIFNESVVDIAYQWSSLPALPAINHGAIMGLCVENPGQLRLERVLGGSVHTILALRDPSFFLTCPNIAAARQPGINAAGPVGGSATGFSDFGPVDALGINLSYAGQPSTVQAGMPMTPGVRLFAQGAGGTPLPEVALTITLIQISGTGNLSGGTTKSTGTSGFETFPSLRVSAPGTYALLATASLAGYPTVQLQSAMFTVVP